MMFRHIEANSKYAVQTYEERTRHYGTRTGEVGQIDVTKINGKIEVKGKIMESSLFTLERDIDRNTDASVFPRLRFDLAAFDSLSDFRKEEIAVWDGTREVIQSYFEK